MDVTCEKCGAEYEFDESLLGERGATVKCSSCQHVFRVHARQNAALGALKLRFARTGKVETLGSLRELQQRIRTGEVRADDQLGREGRGFRRLADVPELKNFFSDVPPAKAPQTSAAGEKPLRVNETSMPPSSKQDAHAAHKAADPAAAGKRTVLGIGPLNNPNIPPPPRVPHVPGALPAQPRPAGSDTVLGRPAPISSIPTVQGSAPTAKPAPVSSIPTAPDARGPRLAPTEGPAIARPAGETPRTLEGVPGQSPPVKLYLAEDEAPPARATAGSSKTWLWALAAVVLGGAGWFGMNIIGAKAPSSAGTQAEAASQPAAAAPETPQEAPPSAPAPQGSEAQATPPAEPKPGPDTEKPAAADADDAKAAAASSTTKAKDEPKAPAESTSERTTSKSATKSERASSDTGGREPTDYNGWVARGDQLFSRGDMAGARQAYQNAIELRGSGSEANTGLGFTLLHSGRVREAIPYFDRAAHAGYAEANIGLGDAYRKLGEKSSAIEAYETYLLRLPTGAKAQYARTQILNLKSGGGAEKREPAPQPSEEYRPAGEIHAPPAPSADETNENAL